MKKVFALVITGVLAASMLAGCGGNSSSSADKSSAADTTAAQTTAAPETTVAATTANDLISGKWTLNSFTAEGTVYSLEEYAEKNEVPADSLVVNYEFDAAGNVSCTALGMTVSGTYTFDGKTVQTTFEGYEANANPKFDYDAEKDTLSATDTSTGVVTTMVRAAAVAEGVTPTDAEEGEEATGEVGEAVVSGDAETSEAAE